LAGSPGLLDDLRAGRGAAVLVEGEPGIGKSALLRTGLAAAGGGCAVFSGTGEELGQTAPLLPLLTALGVRAASPEPRRAEVLGILRGQDGATAAAEALLELIDELCAESPAVLVVDDLHWADAVTVSVCHRLAHSVIQRPLLLVGAMRPLPRRDDLRALRRAVGREGLVRLGPLPPAAVAELVARNVGGRPGPGLARLTADAAGNPLYLTELVDALDRAHRLTVAAGQADVIGAGAPATLSEAIRDRIDFLGGAGTRGASGRCPARRRVRGR
jgi:predicted ATPase